MGRSTQASNFFSFPQVGKRSISFTESLVKGPTTCGTRMESFILILLMAIISRSIILAFGSLMIRYYLCPDRGAILSSLLLLSSSQICGFLLHSPHLVKLGTATPMSNSECDKGWIFFQFFQLFFASLWPNSCSKFGFGLCGGHSLYIRHIQAY